MEVKSYPLSKGTGSHSTKFPPLSARLRRLTVIKSGIATDVTGNRNGLRSAPSTKGRIPGSQKRWPSYRLTYSDLIWYGNQCTEGKVFGESVDCHARNEGSDWIAER